MLGPVQQLKFKLEYVHVEKRIPWLVQEKSIAVKELPFCLVPDSEAEKPEDTSKS